MIAMDNTRVLTGALKGPVVRPRSISSGTIQNSLIAGWRSPIARLAHNQEDVGLNPTSATNFARYSSLPFLIFFASRGPV